MSMLLLMARRRRGAVGGGPTGVGADMLNASDGFTYSLAGSGTTPGVFSGSIAATHDDTASTQVRIQGDVGNSWVALQIDFGVEKFVTEVTLKTGANDNSGVTRIHLEWWNGSSWVDDTLNLYFGAGAANSTLYTKTLYPSYLTTTKIRYVMTCSAGIYSSIDEVEAKA